MRMRTEGKPNLVAIGLLERSLLFREIEAERDEILRHKWLESEKAGRDIGYDLAAVDWKLKHGTLWRRARRGARSTVHF